MEKIQFYKVISWTFSIYYTVMLKKIKKKYIIFICCLVAFLLGIFIFYQPRQSNDECYSIYSDLNTICESGNLDECIIKIKKVIESEYTGDSFLYLMLGSAYYATDNIDKSILSLENSLTGEYLCETYSPYDELVNIEKAQILLNLSKLHEVAGNSQKSNQFEDKAVIILKNVAGTNYDEEYLSKIKAASYKGLIKFKKDA